MKKGKMLRRCIAYLNRGSKLTLGILSFFLILLFGAIDVATGYELSLAIFYLIPIALVSWFVNTRLGLWYAALSSFVWLIADAISGHPYSHPYIPYWNTAVRFGFFAIISLILSRLRANLELESGLARRDLLTGLPNNRWFQELAALELKRSTAFGQPLTLAYVVADGLQFVNDRYGRVAGDQAICAIARTITKNAPLRDLVARLASSEFALVLPQTDAPMARVILGDLQMRLRRQMQKYGRPMTFSIAAVTCTRAPESIGMLIHEAEQLTDRVRESKDEDLRVETVDWGQPLQ